MKDVTPRVRLIAKPEIDWAEVTDYLAGIGASRDTQLKWHDEYTEPMNHAQSLVEFGGRMCYRSWEPGLNPNVSRVREDRDAYLENILRSAHGSVLEHAQFSFILQDVSRVLTHELARHRAGTAISQESLRYVRLDEIPFWFPKWVKDDPTLLRVCQRQVEILEQFQKQLASYFDLDNPEVPFSEKKHKTSFMRRLAPEGLATSMVWSANIRTLRHVVEMRTAKGAEEEIRLVFGQVAEIMRDECPVLFSDFTRGDDGEWVPEWRKV